MKPLCSEVDELVEALPWVTPRTIELRHTLHIHFQELRALIDEIQHRIRSGLRHARIVVFVDSRVVVGAVSIRGEVAHNIKTGSSDGSPRSALEPTSPSDSFVSGRRATRQTTPRGSRLFQCAGRCQRGRSLSGPRLPASPSCGRRRSARSPAALPSFRRQFQSSAALARASLCHSSRDTSGRARPAASITAVAGVSRPLCVGRDLTQLRLRREKMGSLFRIEIWETQLLLVRKSQM